MKGHRKGCRCVGCSPATRTRGAKALAAWQARRGVQTSAKRRRPRQAARNPRGAGRWFWGPKIGAARVQLVFASSRTPTRRTHGALVGHAVGPFATQDQAIIDAKRHFPRGRVVVHERDRVQQRRTAMKGTARGMEQNPPVEIYDRILEIRAQKGARSQYPRQRFVHRFRKGARVLGMPDGSLRVEGTRGQPLWRHV